VLKRYCNFFRRACAIVCAAMLFFLSPQNAAAAPFMPSGSFAALQEAKVKAEQIKVTLAGKAYEGSAVNIEKLTITYSDGLIETFSGSQIHFVNSSSYARENSAPVLHAGRNEIRFRLQGSVYHFYVDAVANTPATLAARQLQDEISKSLYSHTSDSIFVTIRKYKSKQSEYLLTHVIINEPSQIRSGLSHDSYGGEREKPSDASKRMGWIVGVNGSNFNWGTGRPEYAGHCIKNGKLMEGGYTNGMEICLKKDGTLFSPQKGLTSEELISMGVTDTWSCGDCLLISDGKGINYGIQSQQYRYPRTAVGMVKPGEYYLITAGSGGYEGGMTYDEVREVLLRQGCTFGKCMDGGGSSTLVFENEVVNPVAKKGERAVVDFLFFTG